MVVRGTENGYERLRRFAIGRERWPVYPRGGVMDELEDMLLEIKDTSELMVDLAYSSLLYNNRDIAEEVYQLDIRMRELEDEIQEMASQKATEDKDTKKALLIIRLAQSVEEISDAARKIADVVLRDVEPHPVIQLSLRETDVIITAVTVGEGSDLAGSTLGALQAWPPTAACGSWPSEGPQVHLRPGPSTTIMEGDTLYARGPRGRGAVPQGPGRREGAPRRPRI